ncbi:MAG TPA: Cof-type HAD-IIB family hydrolase [Candidatus Anaerobutyricum stercoris]|uniref:Cof-type HAD-IIB family hydrolase n=1 Tax=Candidatus Anaerobutyricum stercoris TaxID=2838457 RepID=A0A9D2EJE2_9FIRM|nr:Cof-type HAD-IIB family hydrolase [Candidatus Anaerobutyricum stercoris]
MAKKRVEKRDIRLIGLDLDGTTLTTDKKLTPHTKEVLEACIRQGIEVLPATGRVWSGIPEELMKMEGVHYVISSNGAAVVELATGKAVYTNGIAWDRALEVFDILERYDTFYDAYAEGNGWCEARFYENLNDYGIEPLIQRLVKSSRTCIEDLREWVKEHKSPIEKINMFFRDEEKRQQAFRELSEIPDLAVTCSLTNNLEINHCTCNKGDALLNLGKILGISMEQIMACGDGNNDLEMVRNAGVGVAMENGEDSVKEAADYVTVTNDEEGVARAIELFCDLQLKERIS